MEIRVNSIRETSLVDGPGVRTVVYLQGCDKHCDGCHNISTWDIKGGDIYDIVQLVEKIKVISKNKKITISGGEPFCQADALFEFIKLLYNNEFDICIYTGNDYETIKDKYGYILPYIHYLKVGNYQKQLRTSTTPYVGSTNQQFLDLKGKINEQI